MVETPEGTHVIRGFVSVEEPAPADADISGERPPLTRPEGDLLFLERIFPHRYDGVLGDHEVREETLVPVVELSCGCCFHTINFPFIVEIESEYLFIT